MVKQGLLKADSARGAWKISEAGRRWLADQRDSTARAQSS